MVSLTVKDLSFSYRGSNIFSGINLSVETGQILSLVGPNGAGKTTLLKCLNALHSPGGGEILIKGKNIREMSRLDIARAVAYVPQSEQVKFPVSVFDTVMLGRRPHFQWRATRKDYDAVFEILCKLEIDNLATKSLDQMSGGERQKVMLAKAIVQEPSILLLDEPTTFLDMGYQLKIMQFVRELVDEKNICAVITTHELNYAMYYSNNIAVLKNGKIMISGPPNIITSDIIRKVYGVESVIHWEREHPFLLPFKAL